VDRPRAFPARLIPIVVVGFMLAVVLATVLEATRRGEVRDAIGPLVAGAIVTLALVRTLRRRR
jgi:hypothetical protein